MLGKSPIINKLSAVLFVALFASSQLQAQTVQIQPRPEEIGSGPAAIAHLYNSGGIPGLGLLIGQPNLLTRNDRAMISFDISRFALQPSPENKLLKATLTFKIDSSYFRDVPTTLEVRHLAFDTATGLVGADMVREPAEVAGKVKITKAETADYTVDISKAVKSDLSKGRKFTSYRISNFTAEEKGNIFVAPWFVKLIGEAQDIPTLTLTMKDRSQSK